MKLTPVIALALVSALPLTGCVAQDDGNSNIDQTLLEQYRSALPTQEQLSAPKVAATTAAANGQPALYPTASWPIVAGINGSVGTLITLLKTIVALPPTVYNSATREFVWGPWPADDGVGYVAAYIKDTGGAGDFQYEYALARGASNDLATLTPIIWGGATPDPSGADRGVGVTLWDFEADRAFHQAYDPNFDPSKGDRGRFATVWGKGEDQNAPGNELAFVVAVFRDFVPADDPTAAPNDLDYFYGRYTSAEHVVDFLDFETGIDVSEPKDGVREDVGIRMAFLDQGTGRAEADVIGGSMAANQTGSATECWDTSLDETYLEFQVLDSGNPSQTYTEGDYGNCGMFQATLDDLNIPSLQDIDPNLLAALDQVATTGVPAN